MSVQIAYFKQILARLVWGSCSADVLWNFSVNVEGNTSMCTKVTLVYV